MDRGDGNGERDVVYVGRYHCAASDYKSKTGEKPKASITRATARTEIHKLGENIWQMDFATLFMIWLLYLVEFADWNSQNCIGYGGGYGDGTRNDGSTDSMPYHTGTSQSKRTSYGPSTQYRNIEGLWDNVCDWEDGCYHDRSGGFNIILNPSKFSDTRGGISVGTPSNGYPSEFTVSDLAGFSMFYPSKAGGNYYQYSCDEWESGNIYAETIYVGGSIEKNARVGLFYRGTYTIGSKSSTIGTRIQELP